MKLPSLSILCLAYNEEENVRWAIPQLLSLLDQVTDDGEVLVVTHPESRDGTNLYLEEMSKRDRRVRSAHQPAGTKGYGPAFAFGVKQVKKEFTFHVDIDGQFLFEDLYRAIELQIIKDADLVHFDRHRRQDRFERKVIALGFKFLIHLFYRCPVWDFDSAFNLFRSNLVSDLQFHANSGVTVPEFMIQVGKRNAVIVVDKTEHQPRRAGKPLWEVKKRWMPFILPNLDIVKANLLDIWRLRRILGS